MANLNIDSIQAGMVLAADVQDRQGRVLLREGMELNDKHIRMLKTWGINLIDIVGEASDTLREANYSDAEIEAASKMAEITT